MWFLAGLLAGIAVVLLLFRLRRSKVAIKWYEWLLGAAGALITAFGFQNIFSASGEPSSVAWTFFLVFALPGIILVLVAVSFPSWRYLSAKYSKRGS